MLTFSVIVDNKHDMTLVHIKWRTAEFSRLNKMRFVSYTNAGSADAHLNWWGQQLKKFCAVQWLETYGNSEGVWGKFFR